MPEKLPAEFSVSAAVKFASASSGFLFAVVTPLETVVQLGVQVTPALENRQHANFSLFYTDPDRHSSEVIASFDVVPDVVDKWTRSVFINTFLCYFWDIV